MSVIAYWLMGKLGISARLASLITWAASVLLVLIALYAAYSWAYNRGEADERTKWEAAAEHLEDADASADAEAIDVAHDMKGQVDAQNDDARAAAADSDDKLRAGLDRLRAQGAGGSNQAPR